VTALHAIVYGQPTRIRTHIETHEVTLVAFRCPRAACTFKCTALSDLAAHIELHITKEAERRALAETFRNMRI
jgi:hypothetical protein